MIAGKEEFVPVQKYDVAAGMAGGGNDQQVLIEAHCFVAFNDPLDAEARRTVVSVHDSLAAKLLSKQLMIRDVIAVR